MALIENIPLNIKNSMRCANNFFLQSWRRQLAACQRLKNTLRTGEVEANDLTHERSKTHNLPIER